MRNPPEWFEDQNAHRCGVRRDILRGSILVALDPESDDVLPAELFITQTVAAAGGDILSRDLENYLVGHRGSPTRLKTALFEVLFTLDDDTVETVLEQALQHHKDFARKLHYGIRHNPAPPVRKTTYLAILPRHRRPKAVPPSAVGYYQMHAREFYEAPGMSAEEARQAIKDGSLRPTWVNGRPVVSTDIETGRQRTEKRTLLGEVPLNRDLVLRLGTQIFTPQYTGSELQWHEHQLSGFTYSDTPMTGRDVERHLRAASSWEIAELRESYSDGFPMGAIASIAASGLKLDDLENDDYTRRRARAAGLSGRPFKVHVIASGDRFTQADAYSLRESR